jgi:hypothetical protein
MFPVGQPRAETAATAAATSASVTTGYRRRTIRARPGTAARTTSTASTGSAPAAVLLGSVAMDPVTFRAATPSPSATSTGHSGARRAVGSLRLAGRSSHPVAPTSARRRSGSALSSTGLAAGSRSASNIRRRSFVAPRLLRSIIASTPSGSPSARLPAAACRVIVAMASLAASLRSRATRSRSARTARSVVRAPSRANASSRCRAFFATSRRWATTLPSSPDNPDREQVTDAEARAQACLPHPDQQPDPSCPQPNDAVSGRSMRTQRVRREQQRERDSAEVPVQQGDRPGDRSDEQERQQWPAASHQQHQAGERRGDRRAG